MTSTPPRARWAVAGLALTLAAAMQLPGAAAAGTPDAGSRVARAIAAPAAVTVGHLTVNGRTDPLGLPGGTPSLGWAGESAGRGVVQSAYQVRVAPGEDALGVADLWDSGKVDSDQQVDVRYGGPVLTSGTRYVWQVRTWDATDAASAWSEPASFETGLLDASDWGGADWIGKSTTGEVDTWSNYTADIDFDIADLAIGVFIRAADTSNAYMWQISTADGTGVPKFRPHKRVNGNYALLDNKPITSITSAALLDGTHRLSVTVDGDTITTLLDGDQIDQRTDSSFSKGFVGFRQDFADGQGDEAADIKAVKVTAENGDVLLDTDFSTGNPFNGGQLTPQGLRVADRKDVLYSSKDSNKPLLRTSFTTEPGKTVESARVYASAQGVYELQLNGAKVGDQFLAPGWTEYRKRIQHQTYDVTEQIRDGDNAFGAELGDGWWAGKIASFGFKHYGSSLGLIAQLRIDYTDGSSQVVKTDNTWKSHFGPYVQADNIEGETYDANAEQPGWDAPGFDATAWNPVTIATDTTSRLVPQPDEPVRVTGEVPAEVHTTPATGVEIYDLGQNMVGVARMTLQGQVGTTVRIRYGEELNPDGTLYTANLRSAKVTDYYTFDETGTSTYTPKFTQHGFRYVEITGTTAAPGLGDVTGLVWGSDLAATGDLTTSDPMLNQLVSNISWGQRGNFLSVPTDTPARDERLGWTGDINVFAPTASYLRDTRAFLGKWMTDLRDAGYGDGNFPGIAPVVPNAGDFGSGLGWSDAAITVPYATWKAWGDDAMVRDNYEAMSGFLDFVRDSAGSDLIDSGRGHWEDWLNLDDPTGVDVLGTAYYAEDARMLSEMAAAIGEDADAADFAQLSAEIRDAFTAKLVAANGTVKGNSQTGYAMALGMDMISDPGLRDKVAAKFVAKLAANNNHLTTGFLGTPWLLPALSSIGRDDLAYTMLLHTDYPSWGYEVEQGATTMWERWNSIMPDGSFGPVEMNSFNHYAYGAVGDWMYQNIGAIKPIEAGYKKIRVAPSLAGGLTHGSGHFESAYGTVATDWTLSGESLDLAVDVPVNTTAEVVLPADNVYSVTEGGALLSDVDGVLDVVDDGDTVTVDIGSGSYDFAVVEGNEQIGAILVSLDTLAAHVGDLATGGDLTTGQRDEIDLALESVRGDVTDALLAGLADDADAMAAALESALAAARDLRAALAESGLDAPVRGDLDGSLGAIEHQLLNALTSALGVMVSLPPLSGAVLPRGTATGTVEITNDGTTELTDLDGTVDVDGLGTIDVSLASLPAGESVQLPVSITVPAHPAPGGYDADLTLDYATDGDTYTITVATSDWVTITSGLEIGDLTTSLDGDDRSEHATVTVPVSNTGTADVRAHAVLSLPDGWATVPSREVVIPAGDEVDLSVPVVVPLDVVAGPVPVNVQVRRGGVRLVAADETATFELPTPPTAEVIDHVDFGDGTSEAAHAIMASPSSGTSNEAGYSRRYANANNPGAWYSVQVDVPAGEPFLLRSIETYDSANTKKYHVYVDDVLVKTQLVPRTEGGQGVKVYDALIDDPSLAGNAGSVRLKYEYPLDAAGFYDPSIADTWVLSVPEDTQAPDVSAVVSDAVIGDNGWFRSAATVEVSAVDNRDEMASIETGQDDGWNAYIAPVTISGEGAHMMSYRATDMAGNRSSDTLSVSIDTVAPVTELTADTGGGGTQASSASLTFNATDATSGVAATQYRLDGGTWSTYAGTPVSVVGVGAHTVDFASTDVAGNPEVVRSATVTLSAVVVPPAQSISVVLAPQLTGEAKVGSTLKASTGTWSVGGLTFAYQWLRDGEPVAGVTGASYDLGRDDVGSRISVRVAATKAGLEPGVAESMATSPVAPADVEPVETIDLVLAPRVSGDVEVGSTLDASSGRWSVEGLDFGFQWLRDGEAVVGATAASYRLDRGDLDSRMSVRVTATKAGLEPGVAESAATGPVAKASSITRIKELKVTKNRRHHRRVMKVVARVASQASLSGKVAVRVDGRFVKRVRLNDSGRAATRVRVGKGKHRVRVVYLGSRAVERSRTGWITIRLR